MALGQVVASQSVERELRYITQPGLVGAPREGKDGAALIDFFRLTLRR